jgi:predicted esterase
MRSTASIMAAVWMGVCSCSGAVAQEVPIPRAESPLTAAERAAYRVSRSDLGRAYLALERAAAERADAPTALVRRVNERFDDATNYFFVGDYSTATRLIVEQVRALDMQASAELDAAAAVRCAVEPRVVVAGEGKTVRVSLSRMYPAAKQDDGLGGSASGKLELRAVGASGAVLGSVPAKMPESAAGVAQDELLLSATPTGRVRVELGSGGRWWEVGSFTIVREPLDKVRERLRGELGANASRGGLETAARVALWRAEQLSDKPSTETSASIVVDFAELAASVEREAGAIAQGTDPYRGAAGDWWMPFEVGGAPAPMRLIVPNAKGASARALIIAVHGAGGDEHLFPVGYGAGEIAKLAEKHGFIVASPRAGVLTGTPATFDAIVETVSTLHNVDRARVFLIGHSLGGAIVSSWAKARPEQVAGVVSIAGVGLFAGAKALPRTLAIAGELDGLAKPSRIERDAQAAAKAGLPVEYRLIPDYGHALVVAKCLPGAVEWMLGKKK